MDSNIEKYHLRGRVSLWKYKAESRNYPGWNLTSDKEGCESLLSLLQLMQASSFSSHKRINLTPPTTQSIKAAADLSFKAVRQLSLRYRKGEPTLWRTQETADCVQLSFGD